MTMHLEGPWLSTTGKRKGKRKFRNAEEARKSRELDASWAELQKKWGVEAEDRKRKRALTADTLVARPSAYVRDTGPRIPSRDTGMGVATKRETPKYTGTLIKGIATMHKSNAVPVLNEEQAVEISHMRR